MAQLYLHDTIILSVVLEVDLNTLKNLRLTCRRFVALIDTYGTSIRNKLLYRSFPLQLVEYYVSKSQQKEPIKTLFDVHRKLDKATWMAALSVKGKYGVRIDVCEDLSLKASTYEAQTTRLIMSLNDTRN